MNGGSVAAGMERTSEATRLQAAEKEKHEADFWIKLAQYTSCLELDNGDTKSHSFTPCLHPNFLIPKHDDFFLLAFSSSSSSYITFCARLAASKVSL